MAPPHPAPGAAARPLAPASVALLEHLHVQRHAAQLGAAAQVRHLYHACALRHLRAHLAQSACTRSEHGAYPTLLQPLYRARALRHLRAHLAHSACMQSEHGAHPPLTLSRQPTAHARSQSMAPLTRQ